MSQHRVVVNLTLDRPQGEIDVEVTADVSIVPSTRDHDREDEVEIVKVDPDVELTDGEIELVEERAMESAEELRDYGDY